MASGCNWKTDITNFVVSNFCQVSSSTVRRLGLPPDKKRHSAIYYRGVIPARPASIHNNKPLGTEHEHAHSCATNVKTTMEFGARWSKYVNVCSGDDKCKLHIGMYFYKEDIQNNSIIFRVQLCN